MSKARTCVLARILAAVAMACTVSALPSLAAPDSKPYDDRLNRLAEILGAVHYLRELCGANDGQYWRDRMRELVEAESSASARRARLTRSFNQGYRSYSRTYVACTPSAKSAVTKFLAEGAQISDTLVKSVP